MTAAPHAAASSGVAVRGVSKRFGSTQALHAVDFEVQPGEVVGLMGANGAGKSTLVNVLVGAVRPDKGVMAIDGRACAPSSPREAIAAGIVAIHQATDRAGAPGLTVAETLLLDRFADGRSGFFVSPASIRRRAAAIAELAGFSLALDRDFADIGPAERQLVAIARALSADARVLIFDEPTASLSSAEAARLFDVIEALAAKGLAIVYISHRTQDLKRLARRVVVLRGGRVVAGFRPPIDFSATLQAMIGRPVASAHPDARAPSGPAILETRGIRLRAGAPPIDLALRAGEVTAITGPLGAGKSRLLLTLFGAIAPVAGEMQLNARSWRPRSPADAIAAGVHLAAEDRRRTTFVPPDWPGGSLSASIALPHLRRWFPHGFLMPAVERGAALNAIRSLGIHASGPDARLDTLSGGNQQKVVLARWLAERPRVLLLDEPFQGVDVGARADIAAAVRRLVDVAALVTASDPEEALEVADRIFVLDAAGLRPFACDAEPRARESFSPTGSKDGRLD
ncbi:sugar ABC transporter ATP-binding protein [Roseiarcus sp.]|uniref:sugar ABC transporter ATP-binding protein n=1 Tax=Roseiarcus sp. TaxID=1969460 RepID=UPI003F9D69CA